MKKIIDGLAYDTEKAEEIAYDYSPLPANDFRCWHEWLYRTEKGNWFLYGEGGPMTAWADHHEDGSSSGGTGIQPLTGTEAQRWLETHDFTTEAEKYFTVEEA